MELLQSEWDAGTNSEAGCVLLHSCLSSVGGLPAVSAGRGEKGGLMHIWLQVPLNEHIPLCDCSLQSYDYLWDASVGYTGVDSFFFFNLTGTIFKMYGQ